MDRWRFDLRSEYSEHRARNVRDQVELKMKSQLASQMCALRHLGASQDFRCSSLDSAMGTRHPYRRLGNQVGG